MAVKQQQPSTIQTVGEAGYTGAKLFDLIQPGTSVGTWLPYIGAGLAAYQAITKGIHGGQQGLAAASFASMPWTGPYGLAAGAFYSIPKMLGRGPNYDEHIHLHEPDLELIHQDEEGNYYLYDNSEQRELLGSGAPFGTHIGKLNSLKYGQGSLIKYNPETNKISVGNLGYYGRFEPNNQNKKCGENHLSLDQTKELFETGQTTFIHKHYPRRKNKDQTPRITDKVFDLADIKWSDFNPENGLGLGGRGSQSFYNMPSLQAQLYNEVLMPGGFAPPPETQSITAGGQQYQTDSSRAVFDSNNRLIGQINNSGQIQTFQKESNRISYGDIDESTSLGNVGTSTLLGNVDNWDQVKQSFPSFSPDAVSQVSGEQLSDAKPIPTIPQISPEPTPGLPDFLMPTTFPGISTKSTQKPTQAQPENELPSFSMPSPLNFNQGVQNMALPPFLQNRLSSMPGQGIPGGGMTRGNPSDVQGLARLLQQLVGGTTGTRLPMPGQENPGGGMTRLNTRLPEWQQPPQVHPQQGFNPPGCVGQPGGYRFGGRDQPMHDVVSHLPPGMEELMRQHPGSPQNMQQQQGATGQPSQPKNLSSFLKIMNSLAQSGQLRD